MEINIQPSLLVLEDQVLFGTLDHKDQQLLLQVLDVPRTKAHKVKVNYITIKKQEVTTAVILNLLARAS